MVMLSDYNWESGTTTGKTYMGIKYRLGKKEDSQKIAEMIETASDGVMEYLFHDLVPGMSPVQVVAYNLGNDNYPHKFNGLCHSQTQPVKPHLLNFARFPPNLVSVKPLL